MPKVDRCPSAIAFRKPSKYLMKGDVMTLGIAGLGEQRQEVVGFKV